MNYLAIDPGVSGGIAWTEDGVVRCCPMPEGMSEQADFIRSLVANGGAANWKAVLEKTGGYMPGNSGPGAVAFARHCGRLEAIIYTLGIPQIQVAPSVWQKALGVLPKEKPERKRAIKEEMQRRFPYLPVTLKTSDALGLLVYAM